MSDEIFLSYARSDRERAKIFAEALGNLGYSVWWDRSIPYGRKFDEYILEKLNQARCVIVLWSKDSVKSDWVRDEAERGKRREILVPVLIDDVDIPLGFGRLQAAQLLDFDGMSSSEEFKRLSESIAGIMTPHVKEKEKQARLEEEILRKQQARRKEERRQREEHERIVKESSSAGWTSHKKFFTIAFVLGILLVGFWLIAPIFSDQKTFNNTIGMEFVLIPAGEFDMGSPSADLDSYDDERPVHHVTISKAFYMGRYEVTQKQWRDVMGTSLLHTGGDLLPVEQVSWNEVQQFIQKLNEKESTNKYRLPSEAEWEYAARARTTTKYSFGDSNSNLGNYAWYAENSGSRSPKPGNYYGYDEDDWVHDYWNGTTHPVGQWNPNTWGLYDMYGNVWEWVQDIYNSSYVGAPANGSAWESGSGSDCVLRGGSWYNPARFCRSAARLHLVPSLNATDHHDLGFRLLRSL